MQKDDTLVTSSTSYNTYLPTNLKLKMKQILQKTMALKFKKMYSYNQVFKTFSKNKPMLKILCFNYIRFNL